MDEDIPKYLYDALKVCSGIHKGCLESALKDVC